MKKFALIVAGGSGERMNSQVPKQFLEINGRPVLMHTIDVFKRYDSDLEVILVLPGEHILMWDKLCNQHQFNIKYKIAKGGDTRFESAFNGLDLISGDGIVFIHDGVRPLVSLKTIENCYEMALRKGNALPVIPVSESVRMIEKQKSKAVDRSSFMMVQTPQTFRIGIIKRAYKAAESTDFTDDATVLENTGETIYLVPGNRENIKITYPHDLVFAESILARH